MYKVVEEKYIEIDDKKYSIYNELTFAGEVNFGEIRPYLRRNTKINIFKFIKNNYHEIYNNLVNLDWYNAYKKDVEGTPEMKVVEGVEEFLKKDKDLSEEFMKDFSKVVNVLSENISDMGNKIDAMQTNTKLEEALIEGIVSKGKDLATDDLRKSIKEDLDKYIKETYGILPKKIDITNSEINYEKKGIFHKDFEKVLKLVNMNLPVMLTGGAGAGKNFMLEQVSDALNMSFYYTSTITQEYKLTGFIDGGGKYHETEFYKAFTSGGIFMLDEIDASIPEALVILNGAIANGYFDFPVGREIAHEEFRVVCAGNTVGLGADLVYTGRNVLDGATLDRFVLVEIDYDNQIEEMLCQDNDLRNFLYEFRKAVNENHINHIVGMRAFKYSYQMLENGFEKDFIIKSVITKGLQKDDLNTIRHFININNDWTKAFEKFLERR